MTTEELRRDTLRLVALIAPAFVVVHCFPPDPFRSGDAVLDVVAAVFLWGFAPVSGLLAGALAIGGITSPEERELTPLALLLALTSLMAHDVFLALA